MWSIRTKGWWEKGKTLSGLIATMKQVARKLVNCMNGRGRKHMVCAAFCGHYSCQPGMGSIPSPPAMFMIDHFPYTLIMEAEFSYEPSVSTYTSEDHSLNMTSCSSILRTSWKSLWYASYSTIKYFYFFTYIFK